MSKPRPKDEQARLLKFLIGETERLIAKQEMSAKRAPYPLDQQVLLEHYKANLLFYKSKLTAVEGGHMP